MKIVSSGITTALSAESAPHPGLRPTNAFEPLQMMAEPTAGAADRRIGLAARQHQAGEHRRIGLTPRRSLPETPRWPTAACSSAA